MDGDSIIHGGAYRLIRSSVVRYVTYMEVIFNSARSSHQHDGNIDCRGSQIDAVKTYNPLRSVNLILQFGS